MPIVDHARVPEVPWRPGYRMWDLVGPRVGMSSNLSYSIAEVGTGAPLHLHEDEELIVVLEGTVEARIGDDVHVVGADHTLAVPRQVPHGFTVVGEGAARLLVFFPVPDPFSRTTYLDGSPPAPPSLLPSRPSPAVGLYALDEPRSSMSIWNSDTRR